MLLNLTRLNYNPHIRFGLANTHWNICLKQTLEACLMFHFQRIQ